MRKKKSKPSQEKKFEDDIWKNMAKYLGQRMSRETERIAVLHETFMVKASHLPNEKMERRLISFSTKFLDPVHGIDHYLRIRLFAQVLWEHLGGDLDSIAAAIWLHDIGRLCRGLREQDRCVAEIANKYLRTLGFSDARRTRTIDAILAHDKRGCQTTDEEMIVYDAHVLDVFNCSGLIRCLQEKMSSKGCFGFPGVGLKLKEHLVSLIESLNTQLAKDLAKGRLNDFLGDMLDFIESEQKLRFRLVDPSDSRINVLFDLERTDLRDDER